MPIKIIILVFIVLFSIMIYQIRFFNDKFIFGGNINLTQFFYLIIAPLSILLVYILMLIEILERPSVLKIPVTNSVFLFFTYILIGLINISLGVHTVSKILSLYFTPELKKEKIYLINRFFHQPFSHSLLFVSAPLLVMMLGIFEVNHPLNHSVGQLIYVFVLFGILTGISYAVGVHLYSYVKKYFIFIFILAMLFSGFIYFLEIDLSIRPYLVFSYSGIMFSWISFTGIYMLDKIKK
ncbi:hypothetical protein GF327_09360 [Candidatus Woesearchaeota archaeon]|nr:hypothetical protein [Candidatus Woesearchaeota archaeon]